MKPLKIKPASWIGVFFILFLIGAFALIIFHKERSSSDMANKKFKVENKRLSEIFAALDSSFWKNKEESMRLIDEAFQIIEKTNDSSALAYILFNEARVILPFGVSDSSLITNRRALTIAENINNDTLIARIKNGIGNYYYDRDNYRFALQYFTEAKKIGDSLASDLLSGMAANGLGLVKLSLHEFDDAINNFEYAYDILMDFGNKRDAAGSLMNIGICYARMDSTIKAMLYQEKAMKLLAEIRDTIMICKSLMNLGLINSRIQNDSLALCYNEQALKFAKQIENQRMIGLVCLNMGSYFIDKDQFGRAEKYFLESLPHLSKSGFRKAMMNANLALSDIATQKGQWEKAFAYRISYEKLKDSILDSDIQKKISDYQWEMEMQKKQLEKNILIKEYEVHRKNNVILVISIVFILTIVLIINRTLRKSIKLQKTGNRLLREKMIMAEEIKKLEKNKHQTEIESKNKELVSFSLKLVTKNDLLNEIFKLSEKYYNDNSLNKTFYNDLTRIIEENRNVEKEWTQFKFLFEQVHHDFFNKLKTKSPCLTENDLRFCAYLKINLGTKEIARLLNISPDTVRKSKYRLKKKLALGNTPVSDFLRNI